MLCFGPTAADYIEGALGLDGVTLGELTATRQAQFVTAVANATSSTVGDVTFLGAEQTIGEYLRVRFRIMSVDASVSLSPFACVWVCLWVCLWVGGYAYVRALLWPRLLAGNKLTRMHIRTENHGPECARRVRRWLAHIHLFVARIRHRAIRGCQHRCAPH